MSYIHDKKNVYYYIKYITKNMKTKILSSLVDSIKKYDLFKSLDLRFVFSNNTEKINDDENIIVYAGDHDRLYVIKSIDPYTKRNEGVCIVQLQSVTIKSNSTNRRI